MPESRFHPPRERKQNSRRVAGGQAWPDGAPVSDPARFKQAHRAGSEPGAPVPAGSKLPPWLTAYGFAWTPSFPSSRRKI